MHRGQEEGVLFPSINRSIDLHRAKVAARRAREDNENLVNYRSSLWGQSLRTEGEVEGWRKKKKPIKTLPDGGDFVTKGNSKLKSELQWLDAKDQEGYRFKFYNSNEEAPKRQSTALR